MIKHTDETHPDYQKLKEAFDKIENVVTLVNEKKQADEDREAVARIIGRLSNADVRFAVVSRGIKLTLHLAASMQKFGVQLMVPGRSLVQEGKLFEFLSVRDHKPFSGLYLSGSLNAGSFGTSSATLLSLFRPAHFGRR